MSGYTTVTQHEFEVRGDVYTVTDWAADRVEFVEEGAHDAPTRIAERQADGLWRVVQGRKAIVYDYGEVGAQEFEQHFNAHGAPPC